MRKATIVILFLLLALAACSTSTEEPVEVIPEPTETPVIVPSPTPTERPPVVKTVCTTSLPTRFQPSDSLFPYSNTASESISRIVSLLYGYPHPPAFLPDQDTLTPSQSALRVILEKVPNQTDGDLRLEPVPVRRGQTLVDENGQLVIATEGVRVRPSGCRESDCVITWDGIAPLEMDQMVVDFALRGGLTWSDGTPLTAADSVFAYRLNAAPNAPGYGWAEEHTQGYSALDDRTLTWVGYPGFASADLARFFWVPLPAHQFSPDAGFEEVAGAELWTDAPPSFGQFMLAEWHAEEILLVRNPHHDGVLPGFADVDQVRLRLIDEGAQAGWEALQGGTCDVLDASFNWLGEPALLEEIKAAGDYEVRKHPGESWTQLVFGIQPAEYDALNNPIFAARPNFFGDVRTRQGIAACLDRQAMQDLLVEGMVAPWPSFLPNESSRLDPGMGIEQNPERGMSLLEEAGWLDHDGDPATPRLSQGVESVFNETRLSLDLLVGPSAFHQDLAVMIQESLGSCGIGVDVQTMSNAELYAPGPDGPLFGRNFDLALIAWQPLPVPDCGLYVDWVIPASGNDWIGTNIAGLSDVGYDRACAAAGLATPNEYGALLAQAEAAFVEQLPAVPLFAPPRIEVVGGSW